jgi:hypothetical protein
MWTILFWITVGFFVLYIIWKMDDQYQRAEYDRKCEEEARHWEILEAIKEAGRNPDDED